MSHPTITSVAFTSAAPSEVRTGLLGWVSCVVDDALLIDGITLRRTRDGRTTLSYPARRDAAGRQHFYVRPIDDEARSNLEDQIFAKLGVQQEKVR